MKKLALIGIVFAFCISLVGCTEGNPGNSTAEKPVGETAASGEASSSTELVLVDTGLFIEGNSFSYALVIENPHAGLIADRPQIRIEMVDAEGETILSVTDHLEYVAAGDRIVYCGAKSAPETIHLVEFELVTREDSWISVNDAPDRVKIYEVASLEQVTKEDGSVSFAGQVENASDTEATLRVSIALFDEAGKAITGVYAFAEKVPPGEMGSFNVAVPKSIPPFASFETYATFAY